MKTSLLASTARGHRVLQRIGRLRDAFLVVGAALYGSGFVAWALYSWMERLGPVSGFDAQYFVAGVPVLAVLAVGWLLGRALTRLVSIRWPSWFDSQLSALRFRIFFLILIAMFVALLAIWSLQPWSLQPSQASLSAVILSFLLAGILLILITLLRFPDTVDKPQGTSPADEPPPSLLRTLEPIMATMSVVLPVGGLVIITALLYLKLAYARIPQALGGGAPRRATIDLVGARLSPETCLAMVGAASACSGVVRSVTVSILATTNDAILVGQLRGQTWTSVELKQEAVVAIYWQD